MGKAIPNQQREETVRLHLCGLTNDEISKNLGISAGSVYNIIQQFRAGLDKPTYESLLYLSRSLENLGISAKDSADGAKIHNLLSKMGVDNYDDFLKLVSEALKTAKKRHTDPVNLLEAASRLLYLESSENIEAEQIPAKIQHLHEQSRVMEAENSRYSEDLDILKEQYQKQFEENKATKEELDRFTQTRKELEQAGLDISDFDNLAMAIKNAKENDYNHKRLVSKIAREESFEEQQLELEQMERRTSQQIESNNITIRNQEKTIWKTKGIIQTLKKFLSLGISSDNLEELYSKVISGRFSSRKEAISYLHHIVKHVNDLGEIESKISQSQEELDKLTQSKSAKSEEIEKQKARISSLKKTKTRLESYIESLNGKVLESIKQISDIIENGKNQMIKINRQHNDEISENHNKALAGLLSVTENASNSIQEYVLQLADTTDEIKNLQAVKSIAKLIKGEGDPLEINILMVLLVEAFYSNLESYGFDHSVKKSAGNFLRQLLETRISNVAA